MKTKSKIRLGVYALITCVIGLSWCTCVQLVSGAVPSGVMGELWGWTHEIVKRAGSPDGIPPTYHLILNDSRSSYPTLERPGVTSRRARYYSFGQIRCNDILRSRVTQDELVQEAIRTGTSDRSWEFVTGCWFSREPAALLANSPDVIISFTRVKIQCQGTHTMYCWSDFEVWGGRSGGDILEHNRAARERLGLAPFPPEFELWLLTGEPASVGEGTFVPPRLDLEGEESE